MILSRNKNIEIIGLNYKDNSENAKIFLKEMGNPYNIILLDNEGTISIEWGAYGVPETFLIYNKKIINFSAISVYLAMIFFFIIILLSDVKLTIRTFVEIFNFDNFLNYENLFPIISIAGTIFAYFSI